MIGGGSRPSPDAGQGGQSYLASVSDLISALIFVFIIMLAVFAYQLANITEEQAIVTEELTAADETRDQILGDIADLLEDSGIRVEVLYEQGVLRLSDNAINFPSGSETPVAEHHVNVGRLAQAIAEVVPCYVSRKQSGPPARDGDDALVRGGDGTPSYCQLPADPSAYECREQRFPWLLGTLLIEGHTDDLPVAVGNRFRDNLELSSMRAATVHRMIAACEPRVELLLNTEDYPILSTSGYGATRPVPEGESQPASSDAAAAGDAGRIHRRIDLRFLLDPPEGALTPDEPDVQTDVRERVGKGVP